METTTFEDAVIAYEKFCKKNNIRFCQPSESLSEIDRMYVHLKSINGELGKYEMATGKFIVE